MKKVFREDLMNGQELRRLRTAGEIPGRAVSNRAGISAGRLSEVERGLVEPAPDELARIWRAIDELVTAREKVAAVAEEVGWPL